MIVIDFRERGGPRAGVKFHESQWRIRIESHGAVVDGIGSHEFVVVGIESHKFQLVVSPRLQVASAVCTRRRCQSNIVVHEFRQFRTYAYTRFDRQTN